MTSPVPMFSDKIYNVILNTFEQNSKSISQKLFEIKPAQNTKGVTLFDFAKMARNLTSLLKGYFNIYGYKNLPEEQDIKKNL